MLPVDAWQLRPGPGSFSVFAMASRLRNLLFLYFMLNIWSIRGENTNDDVTETARTDKTDNSKEVDGDSETPKSDGPTEHAKGSICGYCKYCQVRIPQ